jgi:hypothetical protein
MEILKDHAGTTKDETKNGVLDRTRNWLDDLLAKILAWSSGHPTLK